MSLTRFVRLTLAALAVLALAGCAGVRAAKPDLARLYESASRNPDQPPVIVIHGLMGSTLVDAKTGKEFWPGSLGTVAFGNYRDLAAMSAEDREGEGLVPGKLFASYAGVDFYQALIDCLEQVGRFHLGVPGQPVTGPDDRRRYYVLLYDWRKDNIDAVRKLHELIEQIRRDYHDPTLRVDIIAHSNGGLIANYYLRYGPKDVLDQPEFYAWDDGARRIRRLVMLGTPTLGSVRSLERLLYGTRIALRTIPVEVMATMVTPFESLPHPLVHPIVNADGDPVALDIYDVNEWKTRQWGVFAPDVVARVRASADTPEAGDRAVADLQATFTRNLQRALRFQWALTAPYPAAGVETAVFGGDCELTGARALLAQDGRGSYLVFRPAETGPSRIGDPNQKPPARGKDRIDYERLLAAPGDGLVTRASQVARADEDPSQPRHQFNFFPIAETFFLCESHVHLTANPYFQDNLLYFLLAR